MNHTDLFLLIQLLLDSLKNECAALNRAIQKNEIVIAEKMKIFSSWKSFYVFEVMEYEKCVKENEKMNAELNELEKTMLNLELVTSFDDPIWSAK